MLGCNAVEQNETVQLDSAEVEVEGAVHEVRITGTGASDSLEPARLEAETGDVIRFVAADRRPHAVAFAVDSLSPAVRQYLDRTHQLRGPPLVNEGAAWVVALDQAPPGRYPFLCRSHDAHGLILVRPEE